MGRAPMISIRASTTSSLSPSITSKVWLTETGECVAKNLFKERIILPSSHQPWVKNGTNIEAGGLLLHHRFHGRNKVTLGFVQRSTKGS